MPPWLCKQPEEEAYWRNNPAEGELIKAADDAGR